MTRIDDAKTVPLVDILVGDGIQVARHGGRVACPIHGGTDRNMRVWARDNRFYCYVCQAGGDVIDYVQATRSCDLKTAIDILVGERRPLPAQRPADRPAEPDRRGNERLWRAAQDAWRAAGGLAGSPAAAYLAARRVPPETVDRVAHVLRCARLHPHFKVRGRFAALLAPVGQPIGGTWRMTGLHQTYLRTDGSAKAAIEPNKVMAGRCRGGAVPLVRATNGRVLVGEGIESTVSALGKAPPGCGAVAALALGFIAAVPLPEDTRRVTILAECDAKDARAAERYIAALGEIEAALSARCPRVDIAWPVPAAVRAKGWDESTAEWRLRLARAGGDFNDLMEPL